MNKGNILYSLVCIAIVICIISLSGCQALSTTQQMAQTYINAYCQKPLEERMANRVIFNSGLDGHQIQIQCKDD